MTENMTENNGIRNRTIFLDRLTEIGFGKDHRFSLRYRIKRKKLLRRWEKLHRPDSEQTPAVQVGSSGHKMSLCRRMELILIIIVSMSVAVLTGFPSKKFYAGGLWVDDSYNCALVTVDPQVRGQYPECPVLDESERAHYDDDDYEIIDEPPALDDMYVVEYGNISNEEKKFSMIQTGINFPGVISSGSGDAKVRPLEIKVGDYGGIYYFTENDMHSYILVMGKYLVSFDFIGFSDKAEIENIIMNIRFD